MKKLLCSLMTFLLLFVMVCPRFCIAAEQEPFEPPIDIDEYTLTSSIAASLSISGGTAQVAGRVGAKYASASCSVTVKLQKKNSNGSWSTIKTWSKSGGSSVSTGGSVSVSSGTYRTCVLGTVNYNGDSEYPVKYSGTKTC